MSESPQELSWPEWVAGFFLDVFGLNAEPRPGRPLDHLSFSLHLATATGVLDLFPSGPLDPFRFYHRRHCSLAHEVEYVTCRPERGHRDEFLAYAVFKLTPEEVVPFSDLNGVQTKLKRSYGSFIWLPRARPLLERQYGTDLNDEDPPEGHNRAVAPRHESVHPGRMSIGEVMSVLKSDLTGPELVSWLEACFRQRPPNGEVEHRYYVDTAGELFLVRDHFRTGKTMYQAETSPEALRPRKR